MYNVIVNEEIQIYLLGVENYYRFNNYCLKKLIRLNKKFINTLKNLAEFPYLYNEVEENIDIRKIVVEDYVFLYKVIEEKKEVRILRVYNTKEMRIIKTL
ncbi:MAG: type II toxin-antitoxin system RelE/ParE family toxin [Longicatena sp.]